MPLAIRGGRGDRRRKLWTCRWGLPGKCRVKDRLHDTRTHGSADVAVFFQDIVYAQLRHEPPPGLGSDPSPVRREGPPARRSSAAEFAAGQAEAWRARLSTRQAILRGLAVLSSGACRGASQGRRTNPCASRSARTSLAGETAIARSPKVSTARRPFILAFFLSSRLTFTGRFSGRLGSSRTSCVTGLPLSASCEAISSAIKAPTQKEAIRIGPCG